MWKGSSILPYVTSSVNETVKQAYLFLQKEYLQLLAIVTKVHRS
jgi:hypothetical protein